MSLVFYKEMEEKKENKKSKKKQDNKSTQNIPNKNQLNKTPKFNFYWIYGIIAIGFLLLQFFSLSDSPKEITWQRFVRDMLSTYEVEKLVVVNRESVEVYIKKNKIESEKYKDLTEKSITRFSPSAHYFFTIGSVDSFEEKLAEAQKQFSENDKVSVVYETRKNWGGEIFSWVLPILIMVGIWIFIMRRMSSGGGSGTHIFNIGKSKATLFDKNTNVNITFNDVAGLEEAKQEVKEVVDFLKSPEKYTALGGKIPKGVLLVGAPGTGKTLLAKAVAGEAQVPFFSLSGSDFVEMFVGVGASRVRDLFRQAKDKAPCIIFIDEIDAIGRSRLKAQIPGGNDERESTLNQLLVEMDGFSTNSGVIILGATNRPDVLDSALLRPGRFDRQIAIDKPDMIGREQIFNVHLKPLKLNSDVDSKKLAAQTPGFAGAEIANVCNEAALIAARKGNKKIGMEDFQDAIDRVIGGLEKKNKIISPEEKKIVAYHEAGHAIAGWHLEHADPLVKVSIVPRGIAALGYAQYLPKEQFLYTKEQLIDGMCMTLGGRVAEDIIFNKISTGAQNDLERITKLAYAMVSVYGMNDKVGNVSFNDQHNEYTFNKPYSDHTANLIDEEVRKLIQFIYERTKNLLISKKNELDIIAKVLLDKEIIFQNDLEQLIGKRPFAAKTTYDEFVNNKKENKDSNEVLSKDKSKTSENNNLFSNNIPHINKEEKPQPNNNGDEKTSEQNAPKEQSM